MPTCALNISPDVTVPLIVQNSTASGLILVPNVPAILGQSIYVQALVSDPGFNLAGLTTSDGGQLTFGAN